MKRLGIMTGGGDAPGLNAVIRAAVKTALALDDCEVVGLRDGFDGLIEVGGVRPLTAESVRGILPRGGTILGTANRGNPFARQVVRDGVEITIDVSDQVVNAFDRLGLEGLIVVGGDGTLRISRELHEKGCPIVGVPKTIDNDVGGTDVTFGFDTAVNVAVEALDRLHTTAEAHHRAMVLEVMGRDAGFIALHAGIAGGADVILIPEIPFRYERALEQIQQRARGGRPYSVLVVSEGACPVGGVQRYRSPGDESVAARLGGMGLEVADYLLRIGGVEARATVLGHLQRGGSPTAFDRWLATRFGGAAARLALQGGFGRMVALRGTRIVDIPLSEALEAPRRVDLDGDAVLTARQLGVSLGD
ncbi:MAG: 6-phosphofructokinase [Chloroflexi bacterium RBG_13_68_17]|nr:MAG: 6-phosphofructokinase [Chloroflexi bacterium RBG_13_68_17]